MSNLPALAEIVEDGKTGCLYPAGNGQELSHVIRNLLENNTKRVELGSNARSYISEQRTWRAVVSKMQSKYEELVQD